MIQTKGFATHDDRAVFGPFSFERRELGPHDILLDIQYCGICHSDIHQAKNEWAGMMPATYPMVPGHEIVGKVTRIGDAVTKFAVGDIAGIGCFVDSCRECENCTSDLEQYCQKQCVFTYNGTEMDRLTPTFGGYSDNYVVAESYALKVAATENLAGVAPLLCAGITTYSPLKRFGVGPGHKVGVVGLGGLGHMAVKIATAMGAEVTVFSTSPGKEADARALGAGNFVLTRDPENLTSLAGTFNLILDTVSADHELAPYLNLLGVRGAMVVVGMPSAPPAVHQALLIMGNKTLAGSLIGGIAETQEMLDFCATHKVTADVEIIPPERIGEAYDRTVNSDVRYRFVIDMRSEAGAERGGAAAA